MAVAKEHQADRPASGMNPATAGASLPRIPIRPTPFNDLYLILDMLLPSAETARFLRDPGSFARDHEESLRAAWQLIKHSVTAGGPQGPPVGQPADGPRAAGNDDARAGTAGEHRSAARPGRISDRSLLR